MNFFNKFYRNKKPLISILVPCYNSGKTLPATLKSIQKSKYKNLDVMIVDDGHPIKVKDIVSSFNDKRFRYFDKDNEGLGLTRNFGIKHALGEYIFFLDSDDLIYPDSLSKLLEYAIKNNLDVVSGVTVRKDFESGIESEWCRHLYKTKSISYLNNRLSLFDDTLSTNKLYKVNILIENNIFFEKGLYEDKLFTAKLYSKIAKIGLIDSRVYTWLIYGNQTSITTSKSLSNFKGRMESIYNLWKYIPEIRKPYQIAFFINHDLLIYLREFIFYTKEEKEEIYRISFNFIKENKKYIYKRIVSNSVNLEILNLIIDNDFEGFVRTSDILSEIFQENLKKNKGV